MWKKQHHWPAGLCRWLGLLGILAVALAYLPLTAPRLFGIQIFAITSGSMAPEIPTGSIVYAGQTDPAQLEAGDVIVFQSSLDSQGTVTHRVVSNDRTKGELITKGDANPDEDLRPVAYANVVGLVKGRLPLLGWVALSFETLGGKLASVAVLTAAAVLFTVGNYWKGKQSVDKPVTEGD